MISCFWLKSRPFGQMVASPQPIFSSGANKLDGGQKPGLVSQKLDEIVGHQRVGDEEYYDKVVTTYSRLVARRIQFPEKGLEYVERGARRTRRTRLPPATDMLRPRRTRRRVHPPASLKTSPSSPETKTTPSRGASPPATSCDMSPRLDTHTHPTDTDRDTPNMERERIHLDPPPGLAAPGVGFATRPCQLATFSATLFRPGDKRPHAQPAPSHSARAEAYASS